MPDKPMFMVKEIPVIFHLQSSELFHFYLTVSQTVCCFVKTKKKTQTLVPLTPHGTSAQNPERNGSPLPSPSTLLWELCSISNKDATVKFLPLQRYRPTGSTFMQVKLSGYLDSTTGLPSRRTSLRLGRR